jgi:cytochrome c peroxidase
MTARGRRGRTALDGATFVMATLIAACGSARHGPFVADDHQAPVERPPVGEADAGVLDRPPPAFGVTQTLADSPPPISGGTLVISSDDALAAASDPDRDRVYLVDLAKKNVVTVQLSHHDEPGRLVFDGDGHVHVLLRSGGALVTLDRTTGAIVSRRPVCVSPRGIDYDPVDKRLVVACETGEVLAVDPSASGTWTVFATLGNGLRDVVVVPATSGARSDERIYVSRFRTAELDSLDADGKVLGVGRPQATSALTSGDAVLAWRLMRMPDGPPAILHQFASLGPVVIPPPNDGGAGTVAGGDTTDAGIIDPSSSSSSSNGMGGYGGASFDFNACSTRAIVRSAVSATGISIAGPDQLVLPVDGVWWSEGFAVIAAGNAHTPMLPQVFALALSSTGECGASQTMATKGQPIAIAALQNGSLWVQSREPAQLENPVTGVVIPLASDSREDTGHAIFHSNSGAGIACASCHAEGGDDGHVWSFTNEGKRRTPSLAGTIAGTAPYHWDGTMTDIGMLADAVMTERMSGPALTDDQKGALQSWIFAVPPPARLSSVDPTAVARGKALFDSTKIGCSSCHSGPRFTTSATVDVGTGRAFQVPPLVGVRMRAPYLHDGCAATLADRFGPCGGSRHGNTASLGAAEIADLVAYLESL